MGGFVAVAPPLVAAVAALELFAEAGEIADRSANGRYIPAVISGCFGERRTEELANSERVQWQ